VSTILEIDTSREMVLTMDNGEYLLGTQQVKRLQMLVDGVLVDNPDGESRRCYNTRYRTV